MQNLFKSEWAHGICKLSNPNACFHLQQASTHKMLKPRLNFFVTQHHAELQVEPDKAGSVLETGCKLLSLLSNHPEIVSEEKLFSTTIRKSEQQGKLSGLFF